MLAPRDLARFFFALGDDRLAAGAVPDRQLVTPPDLARDVPVSDVLEPPLVGAAEHLRNETDAPRAVRVEGRDRERLHPAKPLKREQRLYDRAGTRRERNRVAARLGRDDRTLRFEVAHDGFACGEAVEAAIGFRRLGRHLPVEPDHARHRQAVAFADGVVDRIVRRRDLHGAGAELAIDHRIGDDRNASPGERNDDAPADPLAIARVVRMDGDRRVAEHRLRPRGRDLDREASIFGRIADRPKEAVAFLVVDFGVGKRRLRIGIPVDQPRSAIDEPLAIELHENLDDRSRERRIQGEALARPIWAEAERAKRLVDGPAVIFAPAPDARDERVAAERVARQAFFGEFAHHDGFGGDRGVILTGQPIGVLAQHSMVARQHVHRRVR